MLARAVEPWERAHKASSGTKMAELARLIGEGEAKLSLLSHSHTHLQTAPGQGSMRGKAFASKLET